VNWFDRVICCIIFFLVVFWVEGAMSVDYHEAVHHQIFEYCGINSTVRIDWLSLDGVTVPAKNETGFCEASVLASLNAENEIFSYNLTGVEFILCVIATIVFYIALSI
jgi:hypothetical protein